jgi:hypothetical protein
MIENFGGWIDADAILEQAESQAMSPMIPLGLNLAAMLS